ncbi:HNH endonuclease [Leucobacter chromiiresistens]
MVDTIWRRDRGRCGWCGAPIPQHAERGTLWHVHHREPRGSGGAHYLEHVGSASNGVLLHAYCHLRQVERFRVDALITGFLVRRNGVSRPHEVPIRHAVHGWCRLTQEGGHEPCDPPIDD